MPDPDPNATSPDNGLEPIAGTCEHCGTTQLAKSRGGQAEATEPDTAGKKISGATLIVCTGCGAVQATKKSKSKPKPKGKAKRKPARKAASRRASTAATTPKSRSRSKTTSKGGQK